MLNAQIFKKDEKNMQSTLYRSVINKLFENDY